MSTGVSGSKRRSKRRGNWAQKKVQEGTKKARGDSPTLRFLLHSKHADGIIGEGGEIIKRLRSDFSANVTVPDTNTIERVLTISADKKQCVSVLKECLPLVHEPPYSVGGHGEPNQFEVDFLVLSGQVGGIMGKGGARIKQLKKETNVKIKVYQDCLPDSTERVIALGGSEEEIVAALEQILVILENEPMKGNTTLYDPSYEHQSGFDSYNNNFFDGWSSNGNFVNTSTETTQVTVTNDINYVMVSDIIGKNGERISGIRQKSGADIKFKKSKKIKCRLVTIKGNHDQIQHAQYLMQQCVREHKALK